MEMLNKFLHYNKLIVQGISFFLVIMNCAHTMTMGKSFNIEEVEEYNPYGNQVVIQTEDQDYVTVDEQHLDFFQTLTNACNDTDIPNVLDVPITTQNYALLTPFCLLAEELTALKIKKASQKKAGLDYKDVKALLQDKKEIIAQLLNKVSIIELLNAVSYLGCSDASLNQLLNILKQDIETAFANDPTKIRLDNVLQYIAGFNVRIESTLQDIAKFDVPSELSVYLGRKFIDQYASDKSYNLIRDIIADKNVETYAVSLDKKYCSYIENGEVKISDIVNKKEVAQIDLNATLIKEHIVDVINLSFSPDGTMLAIALTLEDNQSAVYIYLLDEYELKNNAQGENSTKSLRTVKDSSMVSSNIINISFSPCSKKLLISGDNKVVIEWDIDGESLDSFKDKGRLASAFFTYNQAGEKIEDRLSQYRKKMRQLLYKHNGLYAELYSLKAEHAFLFIQIVKNVVETGKFNLRITTYTKACYEYLLTNPVISIAIKDLISKPINKQPNCTIS